MKIVKPDQFREGYMFTIDEVRSVVSPEYAKFLKEADYLNLDTLKEGLFVADSSLRADDRVQSVSKAQKIDFYKNNNYVVGITQQNARRLINGLGGQLLTSLFMYKLVIKKLKEAAEQERREAKVTLEHMSKELVWHLEDRILAQKTLVINNAERKLDLPKDCYGRFDEVDMNDFGYPTHLKNSGEFYYWAPRTDEIAAIRGWFDSRPSLSLSGVPGLAYDWLGVVFAKFF